MAVVLGVGTVLMVGVRSLVGNADDVVADCRLPAGRHLNLKTELKLSEGIFIPMHETKVAGRSKNLDLRPANVTRVD